jgi:hypothetical protein
MHKNCTIQHALNGGEKVINGFSIDGYIELPNTDVNLPYRIGFEYFGCRFHQCEWGCMKSIQTKTEQENDLKRLEMISLDLDELKIMRSCQWYDKRKKVTFKAELSQFIGQELITSDNLINAVRQWLTL